MFVFNVSIDLQNSLCSDVYVSVVGDSSGDLSNVSIAGQISLVNTINVNSLWFSKLFGNYNGGLTENVTSSIKYFLEGGDCTDFAVEAFNDNSSFLEGSESSDVLQALETFTMWLTNTSDNTSYQSVCYSGKLNKNL